MIYYTITGAAIIIAYNINNSSNLPTGLGEEGSSQLEGAGMRAMCTYVHGNREIVCSITQTESDIHTYMRKYK